MSLSKRSMKPRSKCIFIDDFLRGGGTAQGIKDLLNEFESELIGIGVLIDNIGVTQKRVDEYISIVQLRNLEDEQGLEVKPSNFIL